jgi:hypothetical protein
MSPKRFVLSMHCKTRVALEKPCKERLGIVIGQLTGPHCAGNVNGNDLRCHRLREG